MVGILTVVLPGVWTPTASTHSYLAGKKRHVTISACHTGPVLLATIECDLQRNRNTLEACFIFYSRIISDTDAICAYLVVCLRLFDTNARRLGQ